MIVNTIKEGKLIYVQYLLSMVRYGERCLEINDLKLFDSRSTEIKLQRPKYCLQSLLISTDISPENTFYNNCHYRYVYHTLYNQVK